MNAVLDQEDNNNGLLLRCGENDANMQDMNNIVCESYNKSSQSTAIVPDALQQFTCRSSFHS